MNEDHKIQKVIKTSLTAMLIGCILFMFGISIKSSIIPFIINFVLSLLLFIVSYLAVHNNNKNKVKVLTYLEYLNIFFVLFIVIVFILELL